MNIIMLFNHQIYCETVAVVAVLTIGAKFVGSDEYFDYWRGVDGQLYGTY